MSTTTKTKNMHERQLPAAGKQNFEPLNSKSQQEPTRGKKKLINHKQFQN